MQTRLLLTAALTLTMSAFTANAAVPTYPTSGLLSVLPTATGHEQAAPAHTVTMIPLLPGYNLMAPLSLNNFGDVVGTATDTTGVLATHTFLYRRSRVIDLGALGTPIAINAFGAILTSSSLYQGGRLVASAPSGCVFTGLNDFGQTIGGGNQGAFYPQSGFLRQPNGRIVSLTFQGSPVYPVAINDAGQIVGDYSVPNNLPGSASETGNLHRVVFFRAEGGKNGVDIGTLIFWTFAGGLNIWGQVVGNSQVLDNGSVENVYEAPVEAVIYSGGRLKGLESLFGFNAVGYAEAINDFGTIAGTAGDIFDQGFTAAVYAGGVWYSLNEITTGLPVPRTYTDFLTACLAMNDEGVIIAEAQPGTVSIPTTYYLLTPTPHTTIRP